MSVPVSASGELNWHRFFLGVTRRSDPDLGHEDWTYNSAGQVLVTGRDNHHHLRRRRVPGSHGCLVPLDRLQISRLVTAVLA